MGVPDFRAYNDAVRDKAELDALTAGPFMWSKTDDRTARTWWCESCAEGEYINAAGRGGAEQHVITTGHTVHIKYTHVETLEGVATGARAADL